MERLIGKTLKLKRCKFSPFNAKRQCKESTRMIIEKGSVIAISRASEDDINTLKKGVGAYLVKDMESY